MFDKFAFNSTRLSYLTVYKFRIVVETRRNRPRIVRTRCVTVCGYRAGYCGLGLAQLSAQIWFEIEDFRPDPYKFSGFAEPTCRFNGQGGYSPGFSK